MGSCRPDYLSSPLQTLPWDPHVLQGRVQRASHDMPGPRDLTWVVSWAASQQAHPHTLHSNVIKVLAVPESAKVSHTASVYICYLFAWNILPHHSASITHPRCHFPQETFPDLYPAA